MPNEEQMNAVGESCSEFDSLKSTDAPSCAHCAHWVDDEDKCELDIFDSQLTSLDQT